MRALHDLGILVGADWAIFGSEAEAKKALKEAKAKRWILYKVGVDYAQTYVNASSLDEKDLRLPLGALVVASAVSNAIVCHEIDDQSVWVCIVRDGLPLPGYDIIVAKTEALSIVGEMLGYMTGCEVVGEVQGATRSLRDVLASVPDQQKRKCVLRRNISPFLWAIPIVFVVAAGLGFMYWQDQERLREAQRMMQIQLAQSMQSEAQKKAALEAKRKAYQAQVHQEALRLRAWAPTAEVFDGWVQALAGLPLSVQGWHTIKAECDLQACRVTWGRMDARASVSSAALLPGSLQQATDNTALTAIPLPSRNPMMLRTHDARRILQDIAARLAWLKGVALSVAAPDQDVIVASPDAENIPPQTIGKQGKWQLQAPSLSIALVAVRDLDAARVARLEQGDFSIKNGVITVVSLSGTYVEQ